MATSGPAKGAERDEDMDGYTRIIVLLVLRRVRSGRKSWVVKIGERRRVLIVSTHDDGGIVATGPATNFGEGTSISPLNWQTCGGTPAMGACG